MAAPPDEKDKTKGFDGDEEHDDATMITSSDEMERMKAEIAAAGLGTAPSNASAPPPELKPRERTTLPPEPANIQLAPELTGAHAALPKQGGGGKSGLFAAIAVCVLGVGVLLVALMLRK